MAPATGRRAESQPASLSSGRARGDAGSVLVEFALVAPLLFLLLFGIVDWGLVISDQISMRDGVREGARRAVVADVGAACGVGTFTANQQLVCFTKTRMDVHLASVYVRVKGSAGTPTIGQDIVICAIVRLTSASGLFTPWMAVRYESALTVMRVEQTSALVTGGDVDPSQRGWSWCT